MSELRAGGSAEWENAALDDYLEALSAWIADSPGYFANRGEEPPEQPSWSLVAMMLAAARSHE